MGFKIIDTNKSIKIGTNEYQYGELLLNFIYTDYSSLLDYIYNEYIKLPLNCEYSNIQTFFENTVYNNPYNQDEKFKHDPFFKLILFELFKIESNLDSFENFENTKNLIQTIIYKVSNLQDLYYEALNICFNTSHKTLNKYSINARLDYYSKLPCGINAITHLPSNTSISESYILVDDITDLNTNLFDLEQNYQDDDFDTYPSSTDVESRLDVISYNSSEKELHHTKTKDYNLPSNPELLKLKNETYKEKELKKVLNLNSLLDLCSFEFSKLLENREHFVIQECKLCKKLFIKAATSKKEYCNNILLSDSDFFNKPCSSKNVGNKIISELNKKTNNLLELYDKIYKRLDMRVTRNSNSKKELEALDYLKDSKKAFNNNIITSSEFKNLLVEFESLKPVSFNIENLPLEIHLIIDKIKTNTT